VSEAVWQAQWIWGPEAEGRYFYFRRAFEVGEAEVQSATLRVCADTRYRLWLNGQLLGHGPARSDPAWQYYDEYDIGRQLRPGQNVLAALVTHYGIGTCYSRLGRPGFLLQAEIVLAHGTTLTVATDGEWKSAPAPYETGYARMSIQLAYPEVFDARREPANWNLPGFDDSDWPNAEVLGPVGMAPWTTLMPRDIPLPYYRAIAPARMIQINAVSSSPPDSPSLTPAEVMERATRLQPAPPGSVTYTHPALFTVAPQSGDAGVSVVLDFGREVSGFPLLVVRRGGGGRVDIGYSERIEADGTVNPNRWGGCGVHYADRLLMRPGYQRYEPLDHRAFRYLRLDFYDCPESVEMLVEMTTSGYPVAYRGDFQCADALLQRIWEVGRYTTELCMDDGFLDTPWRERGQWLADARVEALTAAYAFGDTALARKALLQYPQSQDETGWFRGLFPADPPFNAILPTFCCLWPVALWEYFLLTGDRSLLEAVWPNVERLVAALANARNEGGLLADLPGWIFVDWASLDTSGQSTAVNALAYDALHAAARIARALGYPDRGGDLQILAEDIKEAVNDLLWDNARGVYVDGIVHGERSSVVSEQANVLAALVGVADARQTERILAALFARPRTVEMVPIATPYFAFYLLRLLFKQGRHEQALEYIRERWGRMLERGATTFWEQWEPHWSLCHAWSAGPTYDLMAEIAGIRPLQPGFEEFTVDLRPGPLSWLRSVVPTPYGDIAVAYHYRTETPQRDPIGQAVPLGATEPAIAVSLTIPTGTRAHVRFPLRGLNAPTIRLNGKPVWEAGRPVPPSGEKFAREGDALTFAILGGRYHIEIARSGPASKQQGQMLTFGMFPQLQALTEEDFKSAEWHGED